MDYQLEQVDELKSDMMESDNKIALFIGAGCSRALNIPLWDNMLVAMNKIFEYYSGDDEVGEAIDSDDYPKVAANIKKKAVDLKKYFDTIREFSKPTVCNYTSLHIEIVNLTKTIVTTNYDFALEEALKALQRHTGLSKYEFNTYTYGEFDLSELGAKRKIFHLHGHVNGEKFILDDEEYSNHYSHDLSDPTSLLAFLYKNFNLLFIGYSFRDRYVVKYLKRLANIFKGSGVRTIRIPNHYCIIPESEYVPFFTLSDLTSIGILSAQTLIDKGIIEERKMGINVQSNYTFSVDAMRLIDESDFSSDQREQLRKLLNRTKEASRLQEDFSQIGIKPIVFSGVDYLRVEKIIKKLTKKEQPFSDKFNPDNF